MSSNVDSLRRGLGAGLVATVALAIMLVAKQAIGLMPQVDLVSILARALGFQSLAAGWTAHFIVGVLLWGPLFVCSSGLIAKCSLSTGSMACCLPVSSGWVWS